MARIDKPQFNQALQKGINLNDAETVSKLTRAGVNVAELKAKADVDADGWIKGGPELERLFKHVDAFDRNGSSASFNNTGRAGQEFTALVNAAGGTVRGRGSNRRWPGTAPAAAASEKSRPRSAPGPVDPA